MSHNPFIAGILSLLVPGLGQIYAGDGIKGAVILAAAIVIANLNIIVLPLISLANPVISKEISDPRKLWSYWIPRIVHDIASFWSIVFWVWAIVDAISMTLGK
jgi:TM2 domain-containing membrane protein YozV